MLSDKALITFFTTAQIASADISQDKNTELSVETS